MGVTDEVKHVIAKELNRAVEQLSDDIKLGDLDADSFNIVEIVFALEEKYDIDISLKFNQTDADSGKSQGQTGLTALATIGDICHAVQALVDAKAAR
jgi:acyl carrier protein